jgi:hypothetical protein
MTPAERTVLHRTLDELAPLRDRVARELPASREAALALTKLDEATLWLRQLR